MKPKHFLILVLGFLYASVAAANDCDEACKKAEAEAKHSKTFPSYLSWSYCDDIRMEFMTSAMRSLESYRSKHLDVRYKGAMRNTKQFINQRQAWLSECNEYLSLTGKGRIFNDRKTTDEIFYAMNDVKDELDALISGSTYSADFGSDSTEFIAEKFDTLFKLVDDHKAIMHLKGKYVFR